jgi:malate/lactate dehydrogenase
VHDVATTIQGKSRRKYFSSPCTISFRNLAYISEGGRTADERSEERRSVMRVKTKVKAGFVTAEAT